MILVKTDPTYMKIWRKEEGLIFDELDISKEHQLCYKSLYFSSKYETAHAQKALKKIADTFYDHSCSIVLEATALVYFSLQEFTC